VSRDTVERYLRQGGWTGYRRPPREGVLGPHGAWIEERFKRPRGNALAGRTSAAWAQREGRRVWWMRDVTVVLSMQEYERLVRLNILELEHFCDLAGASAKQAGMSEATLAELLADD
jgi:hypothetical protein